MHDFNEEIFVYISSCAAAAVVGTNCFKLRDDGGAG